VYVVTKTADAKAARKTGGIGLPRRRHRRSWTSQAETSPVSELRGFAQGLRKDRAAVTAGLTLPDSSRVVEGHVTAAEDGCVRLWDVAFPTDLPARRSAADPQAASFEPFTLLWIW
jgi:hypothetical protein